MDPENGIFTIQERKVTALFKNWQTAIDEFVDWSMHEESRHVAKDAMSAMQSIIIGCRETRLYQRDLIPPEKEVAVNFSGREWPIVKAVLMELNLRQHMKEEVN